MADQPKKKNQKDIVRNADRRNGKRVKTSPDDIFRGKKEFRGSHTRRTPLTEVEKVNLGRGMVHHYRPLNQQQADIWFATRMHGGRL